MPSSDHRLQDMLLHVPVSLLDRAEEMASRESVSLNLFVVMAVAEKLQRLQLQHTLDIHADETPTVDGSFRDPASLVH